MISCGGTGGHIYPALAVANRFRELYPDTRFLFVGAQGKMEMQKVPEAGYQIEGLWISGLQRRLTVDNLMFPFKVLVSLYKARKLLKKFNPDVVIGFGGFASAPMLRVSAAAGIPTLIQEQNSYAGLANKWLAAKVDRICVAYQGMEKFFPAEKIVYTGNPVRSDILDIRSKRAQALRFFGFTSDRPVLLIIGGSLGARTINQSVLAALPALKEAGIQVLWQSGKFYYQQICEELGSAALADEYLRLCEFIVEMDLAYAASTLVVSRAGALSIAELCIAAKPVIFVPSPNVAEDHQTKNAMALVEADAAQMIPDREAIDKLGDQITALLSDVDIMKRLSENIKKLSVPDATDRIVHQILKCLQ
ncbi:MAG: undecaprenyldiphospho-muramoylpentapeptide beta-N-acetylglucosaminyltransferase [Cyclobacteriaceae bacterium]|nr:undecaprenyldiphospho-muramoylpentapeptide beta-N-acetylglucosaminyltransferase [Cyclobacteriaceae bacterium]